LDGGSAERPAREVSSSTGFGRKLKQYFRKLTVRRPTVLESFLGRLELDVLEALWAHSNERSVRELQDHFPSLAYSTLMTTLDRLFKKGFLARRKEGRAFFYAPLYSREELQTHLAARALDTLLGPMDTDEAIRPVLTSFVEVVSRRDELLLDELEKLILAKKLDAETRREED
jgi:predicted transcriptional regulator